jgi:hypothetical protein
VTTDRVRVRDVAELDAALDKLGVRRERPVLVVVGGAADMSAEHLAVARELLRDLVPVLVAQDVAVVDGGTDSGVMKAIGELDDDRLTRVGVLAEDARGDVPLAPNHVHVLVPGDSWGEESPWLAEVASVIAGGHASATLLVNGGEVSYADAAHSIDRSRAVLVVAGTGRTADAIATAADRRAADIAASPLTRVVTATDIGAALAQQLGTG